MPPARRARAHAVFALASILFAAESLHAVEVVWETGALVGTATRIADPRCGSTEGYSSSTFTFDPGDAELAGVDYSDASPGTSQVCHCCGQTGTWRGEFGAAGVTFGITNGNYWITPAAPLHVGQQLHLEGDITFSAPGHPPLPPELTNLRTRSTTFVTAVFPTTYNFQGTFELVGDVPAVCGDGLVTGPEGCDDENTETGDCCDDTCRPEPYLSVCNVGPGGVCNGLGACVDPDTLTSQPGLYAWRNCDADFSIVGARGNFSNPELAGVALAVDPVRAKLYTGGRTLTAAASTQHSRPYKITRTNLDGTGFEDYLVLPPPTPGANQVELGAFAADVAGGQLFWSNPFRGRIGRVSLTNPAQNDPSFLVLASGSRPTSLAVDEAADKLYWSDAADRRIRRADLDGSDVEAVIDVGASTSSISVDPIRRKLYWSESPPSGPIRVRSVDIGGTVPQTVAYAPTPPRVIYDIELDASANVLHVAESQRYRQLDLATGAVTDPGDMSCSFDQIALDPSQKSALLLPGGSGVPAALLGGPASPGGIAAVFGTAGAGTLSARFQRVAVADSSGAIGVDLSPITGSLASAPAQVWQMSYTGSLSGPFTLVIAYDEAAIGPGIAEADLRIRAWDGTNFVVLPGTVDANANRITIITNSLPTVAILGTDSLRAMISTASWGRSVLVLTTSRYRCSPWICFQPWRWFRRPGRG
jgi:cysteine-rich repeat protein